MAPLRFVRTLWVCLLSLPLLAAAAASGARHSTAVPSTTRPSASALPWTALPVIVRRGGRAALLVDGRPFLILGAQVHNSSAWPGMLPQVWPAISAIHANTVEMPVYWEQMEPAPGRYDFSVLDMLLAQARQHHVRLVLLWFATWKNGSGHYMPVWMKRQPQKYFKLLDQHGKAIDSPSPFARATREADAQAFAALMGHLKNADRQHTVIMVQVENETGTYGSQRDYSPAAQRAFAAPVPQRLLQALHQQAQPGETWKTAFGARAAIYFHAWSIARYVDYVAAAGKAVYPLPLYCNAALRDPIHPQPAGSYESGGPTYNVLDVWKAAAPDIDLLAPDIYMEDSARYLKTLDLYDRPDNPLFVPETGLAPGYARYFFAVLGHGAIGFSPFGVDYSLYAAQPLGAPALRKSTLQQFALNYRLAAPIDRLLARLQFEGKLQGIAERRGHPVETLHFRGWDAVIKFGAKPWGPSPNPTGNATPIGRAMIAQLAPNQFLVAGYFCRIDFKPLASDQSREFLQVQQLELRPGLPLKRIWNGDETDFGLNFSSAPQLLRVSLATYTGARY